MASPDYQVVYGVTSDKVLAVLKKLGVERDWDDTYLVDDEVFEGMYSGSGECPEWLGCVAGYLDNNSPFIAIDKLANPRNLEKHNAKYNEAVENLKQWLIEAGDVDAAELIQGELPNPEYYIACGTT